MVTAGMSSLSSYTGSQATKFDLPIPGPVFFVGGDFTTSNIYGTRASVWMDKGNNNNNAFDLTALYCLGIVYRRPLPGWGYWFFGEQNMRFGTFRYVWLDLIDWYNARGYLKSPRC